MKKSILLLISFLFLIPSISSGEDFYNEQLNHGIRNAESYSYMLIQQAELNKEQAKDILEKALQYSPDLPATYFALSKASFEFSTEGIFTTIDYLLKGIGAYKKNFWWLFTMVGSLFTSAIGSLICSVIVIILIRLPFDIPLLSHDLKEDSTRVLLLLALVSAFISPFFLLGGIFVIIGMYMTKWNKLSVYIYFLFLLISPMLFNTAVMFLNASSSGTLKAIVQVNESKGNRYALSVLKRSNDSVEQFSYALALQREGGYQEAMNIYNSLISKRPTPEAYNNLANCYFILGDIEKAKELYERSTALKRFPSNLYNLSVLSRETLDYDKGDEYFLSAQTIDREAVSGFRRIFSKNPNRFVIDERLTQSAFWKYAGRTPSEYTINFSLLPHIFVSIGALVMMVFFFILNRRFKHVAYKCKRCGSILCKKCEKRILWGRMCLRCYLSLIKLDELDAKERITRLLTVYKYQKMRRDIIKFISLILPGAGQIYAGSILNGLLFLWTFLFFLFIPITNTLFVPETSYFSHTWLSVIALILMGVVYIVCNIIIRRRLAKGWL
jgi:tetratricopeptide (TPR) repeat protein